MRLVGQLSSACELAREQISLQLDGELSEVEQVALTGHLTGCTRCRTYSAAVARVSGELRSAPAERPEFSVVLPHRSRLRVPMRAVQLGAAAAVLTIIGFGGAGLTTSGDNFVSLTSASGSADRAAFLKPTGIGRGSIEVALEVRRMPRPIRGHVGVV